MKSQLQVFCRFPDTKLQSETDDSQDQQHRRRNDIVIQGRCPTQSDPVLVRSAQLSPKGQYTQDILPSTINSDEISLKDLETTSHKRESVETMQEHHKVLLKILFNIHCLVVGLVVLFIGFAVGKFSKPPDQFQHQKRYKPQNSKYSGKWSKKFLFLGVFLGLLVAMWIFVSINADITERRKNTL
ncbi:unnamed protein product [Musa textilis]